MPLKFLVSLTFLIFFTAPSAHALRHNFCANYLVPNDSTQYSLQIQPKLSDLNWQDFLEITMSVPLPSSSIMLSDIQDLIVFGNFEFIWHNGSSSHYKRIFLEDFDLSLDQMQIAYQLRKAVDIALSLYPIDLVKKYIHKIVLAKNLRQDDLRPSANMLAGEEYAIMGTSFKTDLAEYLSEYTPQTMRLIIEGEEYDDVTFNILVINIIENKNNSNRVLDPATVISFIHHEFYHLIDPFPKNDPAWLAFNKNGFKYYAETQTNTWLAKHLRFVKDLWPASTKGFIGSVGKWNDQEDRATIYQALTTTPDIIEKAILKDKTLALKVNALKEKLKVHYGLGDAFWVNATLHADTFQTHSKLEQLNGFKNFLNAYQQYAQFY